MANAYDVMPRFIRVSVAPRYCGMDDRHFARMIRPYLTEIPATEKKGIAFDRLELDAVLDDYKARYGRAPKIQEQDLCKNVKHNSAGSGFGTAVGTSTSESTVAEFQKALKRATGKKRSAT